MTGAGAGGESGIPAGAGTATGAGAGGAGCGAGGGAGGRGGWRDARLPPDAGSATRGPADRRCAAPVWVRTVGQDGGKLNAIGTPRPQRKVAVGVLLRYVTRLANFLRPSTSPSSSTTMLF